MKIKLDELLKLNELTYSINDIDVKISLTKTNELNIEVKKRPIKLSDDCVEDAKKVTPKALDKETYKIIETLRNNSRIRDSIKSLSEYGEKTNNERANMMWGNLNETPSILSVSNKKPIMTKEEATDIFNQINKVADEYVEKNSKDTQKIEEIGYLDKRVNCFKTPDFRVKMMEAEEDSKQNNIKKIDEQ